MHQTIIDAINALTPDCTSDGYCRGIAMLSAQSWLVYGEHKMAERRQLLRANTVSGANQRRLLRILRRAKRRLQQEPQREHDKNLVEMQAYLEAVSIAQRAYEYPGFFATDKRPRKQRDIEDMMRLIASRETEAAGGMCFIKSITGCYLNALDLRWHFISLINHLQKTIPEFTGRISIIFQTYDHAIMLGYDFQNDVCNYNCKKEIDEPAEFAALLQDKFYFHGASALSTEIYASGKDSALVTAAVNSYCGSDDFLELQAVTPEKAKQYGLEWLRVAAQTGDVKVVAELLARGVLPEEVQTGAKEQIIPPFMLAVENEEIKVMGLLLAAGVDINQFHKGWTALMYAARFGMEDVVKFLLKRGADVELVDDEVCTAIDHAEAQGFTEIAELIRASRAVKLQVNNQCFIC